MKNDCVVKCGKSKLHFSHYYSHLRRVTNYYSCLPYAVQFFSHIYAKSTTIPYHITITEGVKGWSKCVIYRLEDIHTIKTNLTLFVSATKMVIHCDLWMPLLFILAFAVSQRWEGVKIRVIHSYAEVFPYIIFFRVSQFVCVSGTRVYFSYNFLFLVRAPNLINLMARQRANY